MHHPVDRGKVFDFDLPWEGPLSNYAMVFRDGNKWRMYYRGARQGMQEGEPKSSNICYAESTDGLHWIKPELSIHELAGTKENNVVHLGPGTAGGWYCFRDDNPDTPAEHRYKALSKFNLSYGGPLGVMVSADGFHWKWLREEPVITMGPLDSLNTARWDPRLKKYVAFVRNFVSKSKGPNSPPENETEGAKPFYVDSDRYRAIALTTSTDFIHWTPQRWLNYGETELFEHLYTNAVTPYFRAPHIYVAFPMRYVPQRQVISGWAGSTPAASEGCSDAVFMSSRDGLHWDRRFLQAFVRPGLEPKNWTDRNMIISPGIVQTGPGEMSIYYVSHYGHKTSHLRRLSLRLDGFVSVHAEYQDGQFVTKPLVFARSRLADTELLLNYATSAVGDIRVEIQNTDGTPIRGYTLADAEEIVGDQIERKVTWKNGSNLANLAGRPVRLRFVMSDADLYSIRFWSSSIITPK
ncbi:MAG: hypothetical protein ABGZ35_21740 [Planctomycetaceae bacterium]